MLSTIKSCDGKEKRGKNRDDDKEEEKKKLQEMHKTQQSHKQHAWMVLRSGNNHVQRGELECERRNQHLRYFLIFASSSPIASLAFSFRPSYFVLWHFDSRKIALSEGCRGGGEEREEHVRERLFLACFIVSDNLIA